MPKIRRVEEMGGRVRVSLVLALVSWQSCLAVSGDPPPTCESKIFCQGELLHEVQIQKIYEDSKTFVDLKLKASEEIVLEKFEELKSKYSGKIPKDALAAFVNESFIDCGEDLTCKELLQWSPTDWSEQPSFLNKIHDELYKQWGSELNKIWKKLARIMATQVKEDANLTSLIYVPNGFIIPGGRFREMYYWDTYWIVKGLLVSGMTDTVKGIINNMLSLVRNLGHIPNGSRVYYTQRAQPPMLIPMVDAYVQKTGDKHIVKSSLSLLDREMEYYISNRQVKVNKGGNNYQMYRYFAVSGGPRPESYREDYLHAQRLDTEEQRAKFYVNMKSAAESGWDFSSRWFIKKKSNKGTILDIDTQDIIPADLNAFLHKNFKLMADWYSVYGPSSRASYFRQHERDLLKAINDVLWNDEDGIWYDWDNLNGIPRKYFYMSNFAPLWTESHSFDQKELSENVLRYQTKVGLKKYLGGSPTSDTYSGEQWDYPDAWPPLQSFLIEGLDRLDTYPAKEVAYHLANQWIKSTYRGYRKYGKMFEKYDALNLGEPGSGGEYADQEGFGWTNGLVLALLERYGDVLVSDSHRKKLPRTSYPIKSDIMTNTKYGTLKIGRIARSNAVG